jgi:hypothetical protein
LFVAARDLNGDGKPDLVVGTDSNYIGLLLNNGDGTFGTLSSYTAGTQTTGIAWGDFNGDGKTDVVAANYGSGSISVLLGNGTFQSAANYGVGAAPHSLGIGDIERAVIAIQPSDGARR